MKTDGRLILGIFLVIVAIGVCFLLLFVDDDNGRREDLLARIFICYQGGTCCEVDLKQFNKHSLDLANHVYKIVTIDGNNSAFESVKVRTVGKEYVFDSMESAYVFTSLFGLGGILMSD